MLHLFGAPGWFTETHLSQELLRRCGQAQEKHVVRNVPIQQILTAPTVTTACSIVSYKCYDVLGFELKSYGDKMNL